MKHHIRGVEKWQIRGTGLFECPSYLACCGMLYQETLFLSNAIKHVTNISLTGFYTFLIRHAHAMWRIPDVRVLTNGSNDVIICL